MVSGTGDLCISAQRLAKRSLAFAAGAVPAGGDRLANQNELSQCLVLSRHSGSAGQGG
jgi:hypothetical protein